MADQTSFVIVWLNWSPRSNGCWNYLDRPRSLHRWPYFPLVIPCTRGLKRCRTVGEWPELDKRVMSAIEEASILTDAVDVRVDGVQAEVTC
ncbi:UNVERIFIED_CONTAM: hypothetical protein Sradi_0904300 [Sesamum radiatum]|uniref:Uncharacterized protein n=1 Tax=Sesamum radiatum TaxID=300843 RepID=A0AAW2V3S3_SESRA